MDWSSVRDKVIVGIITALALGGLTLFWNWSSSGGLVHALGGLQVEDLKLEVVAGAMGAASYKDEEGNIVASVAQKECPQGSVLINAYCASGSPGTLRNAGLSADQFYCVWSGVTNPEKFNAQAQAVCLRIVKK